VGALRVQRLDCQKSELKLCVRNHPEGRHHVKAYADAHGGPVLSAKDVLNLPKYVFDELIAETDAAEKRDSERTVESAPSAKNGRSSAK
jgi:hypothetical protein